MNKVAIGLSFCFCLGSAFGSPDRQVPTIRANTRVAGVDLSGMTQEQAAKAMRVWWEDKKVHPLQLHSNLLKDPISPTKPGEMGITLDDQATVAQLLTQDQRGEYEPVFKTTDEVEHFEKLIAAHVKTSRPARVILYHGTVFREPEITEAQVNAVALLEAVGAAIKSGNPVELPIVECPKKIADEELNKITEVVSSFSTHFPKRQYNRNSNIRLAASILNGTVLMPGDKMSFNGTVGERTIKRGFKIAGVYKNGKHDTGIGGGICQVSTTMYNACLFGNVKIVRRSNHSMPVAYVPLGRDATVDYGSLDLVIENDYPTPIAISSAFEPGTLTFRVLGKKDPGLSIKLIAEGGKSWDVGTQTVVDPKLKPGEREVVERGSRGHSITTYKLTYRNGVLQKRELLNRSYYGGGERIIAVGPAATPPIGAPVVPPAGLVGHPAVRQ